MATPVLGGCQKTTARGSVCPTSLTIMLTFKLLITNDVDIWKNLLMFVLTFKLLAINDVDLVDGSMYLTHVGPKVEESF
jgi:hypothetical protein